MKRSLALLSSISDRIDKEIISAMRNKDTVRLSTLRNVKSRITYKLKEPNAPPSLDDNAVCVLIKQGLTDVEKTLSELSSIASDQAKKLSDLALREKAILLEFLPTQASEDDVKLAIQRAIEKHKATSVKEMRVVLADLTKEFDASKFDPKLLGAMVKQMIEKKKD